jgi:ferredoxin, 2Fe-2S
MMDSIRVTFIEPDGTLHPVDAVCGASLMHAAVRHRIPGIVAACGGDGGCATCHVHIDPRWQSALPPPTRKELGTLRFARERMGNSRLACQIALHQELDGLIVTVPALHYQRSAR